MLFDPSGGLKYHFHARRAGPQWQSHRDGVQAFLNEWQKATGPITHLILVGPSGGYSLPVDFLRPLSAVSVIDPDWFARVILKRRFRGVLWSPLPSDFRNSHVLFCNVLGQLSHSASTERGSGEKQTRALIEKVKSEARSWASYHDRFWGNCGVAKTQQSVAHWDHRPSAEEIIQAHGASATELNEHDAEDWLPEILECTKFHTWRWDLRPRQTHWIEACYCEQFTTGVGK